MRVGMLEEECLVKIEPVGERGNFLIRFDDYSQKNYIPEEWKKIPWGYDGFKVFLPPEIIEKKISSIFPGVVFFDIVEHPA
jgi:hypothetical protein